MASPLEDIAVIEVDNFVASPYDGQHTQEIRTRVVADLIHAGVSPCRAL